MSEIVPTSIKILDKEYVVSCPDGEQAALRESAELLNARMREMRDGGKVIGLERIAVISALNVIHDYLRLVKDSTSRADEMDARIRRLEVKIDSSLQRL